MALCVKCCRPDMRSNPEHLTNRMHAWTWTTAFDPPATPSPECEFDHSEPRHKIARSSLRQSNYFTHLNQKNNLDGVRVPSMHLLITKIICNTSYSFNLRSKSNVDAVRSTRLKLKTLETSVATSYPEGFPSSLSIIVPSPAHHEIQSMMRQARYRRLETREVKLSLPRKRGGSL